MKSNGTELPRAFMRLLYFRVSLTHPKLFNVL